MAEHKECKVISGNSAPGLQKALAEASADHLKPILLSSAGAGAIFVHVAVLERYTG
jgi:hypothetical protein